MYLWVTVYTNTLLPQPHLKKGQATVKPKGQFIDTTTTTKFMLTPLYYKFWTKSFLRKFWYKKRLVNVHNEDLKFENAHSVYTSRSIYFYIPKGYILFLFFFSILP